MNKIVLAYNFKPERLQQLRQVCMILKVNCKAVPLEQFDDAVGFVAGVKDCPQKAVNPPENQCGFDINMLNKFLAAVKRGKLKEIELKAALTKFNQHWSGRHLLQEIAAEHVYMKQQGKSMHK